MRFSLRELWSSLLAPSRNPEPFAAGERCLVFSSRVFAFIKYLKLFLGGMTVFVIPRMLGLEQKGMIMNSLEIGVRTRESEEEVVLGMEKEPGDDGGAEL